MLMTLMMLIIMNMMIVMMTSSHESWFWRWRWMSGTYSFSPKAPCCTSDILFSHFCLCKFLCMQCVSNLKSTCGPHTGKHLRCHSFSSPFQRFKWSYDRLSRVIKWRFNCISSTWMLCKNHPEHFWLLSSIHKCRLLLSALMWCWKKLHTWILKSVASDSGGLAWAYILHARLSTNLNQDITLNKVTEWAQYMATSNLEKEIDKCVLGLNRRQRPG